MRIQIEVSEADLRRLVLRHIREQMPDAAIAESDVTIEVKSRQNWKAEWETAAFRATVDKIAPGAL